MSGFSSDWLALREPLDAASRNDQLMSSVAQWRQMRDSLSIVDLGCGAGANLRYLAPKLGGQQDWLLIDDDPLLLTAASETLENWANRLGAHLSWQQQHLKIEHVDFCCRIRLQQLNLAHELTQLPLANVQLVTASALLDLVSEHWLGQLAAQCKSVDAAVLFALTYDGMIDWTPVDHSDESVRQAVNRHQQTDKGFGPALGPQATDTLETAFRTKGFVMEKGRSDWCISPESAHLQRALIDDWTKAATEIDPALRVMFAEWRQRRAQHLGAAHSSLTVGHIDSFGWLP